MARRRAGEEGFTLIEIMVTLAIIAVLVTIGLVGYSRMARIANDKGAQLDLVTAAKVQTLEHLESGEFTADAGVLRSLEPTLRYSANGNPPGSVVVVIEDGRASQDVCLFARTKTGDWFSLYHSVIGGDLYGESAPTECSPVNVASWSREAW